MSESFSFEARLIFYITDDRLAEWDRVLSAGGVVEDALEADPVTARMVRGIFG